MNDMSDVAKLAKLATEAKDALYLLQQEGSKTKNVAEDTKRNLEAHLTKYQTEVADVVAKSAADRARIEAESKAAIGVLEKELATTKKDSDEYKKRVAALELAIAKKSSGPGVDPDVARESAEYKHFFGYLTVKAESKSHSYVPDLDLKTLRTDAGIQGGYLIPQVMDNQIRKNITEISPVRAHARTRMSPSKSMDIPRRLALLDSYYEGETEPAVADQSTYGSETVTLYRQTVKVPASLDMMVSSAFNLEAEIAADVGESMGKKEGRMFLVGTGALGPQGIINDSRVDVHTTAASGALTFDDIAELIGKLKSGQAPWLFFNRRTLSKLWQIKSSIGVPLWQPVAGGQPATIWDYPYDARMIDLASAQDGSNSKPIIFGDLRRGYEIFDMMGISVIRDDLTLADRAITQWIFRRYNTGRVIVPEAIKVLKIQ